MKFLRLLIRLGLLSLAAGAFVELTGIYGVLAPLPLPDPRWQEGRDHRPSEPQVSQFGEFIAAGAVVAIYAVAGRIIFRLRLSPASPSERKMILLNLHSSTPRHLPSNRRA